MPIYRLRGDAPQIADSAYVAPEAVLIGRVTIGEHVCVLPYAVIRGDNETITIGDNSNVQDGAVLHVDPGFPMTSIAPSASARSAVSLCSVVSELTTITGIG